MYFWIKYVGIAQAVSWPETGKQRNMFESSKVPAGARGCRTQLAAPMSRGAPSSQGDALSPLPPLPEMPRGLGGGHGWGRAPRPVQKQWGTG